MDCNQAQDSFSQYWDWSPESDAKKQIDAHLSECSTCKRQFEIWEESQTIILQSELRTNPSFSSAITKKVMNRIYSIEGWKRPIPEKIYSISQKTRRKLMALNVAFIFIFFTGLLYPLFFRFQTTVQSTQNSNAGVFGIQPVASASGNVSDTISTVPNGVASLSDLPMLHIGQIHTVPDYLIALSVFGLGSTLLMMNWISRTKS